jgi:hypothetical protein
MKLTDPSLPVNQEIADPSVARLYIDDDGIDNVWMLDKLSSHVKEKTCTLILPYGIDITDTPGDALIATLFDSNNYVKDDGFLGDILIDGDVASLGSTGEITFAPSDSSKVYYIKMFGNSIVDSNGGTELFWPMNSGSNGMYVEGSYALSGESSVMLSGLKRMPGSWGATGALGSGVTQNATLNGNFTIKITQRDS